MRNGRTARHAGVHGTGRSVRGSARRRRDKDAWVKAIEEGGKGQARKEIAHRGGGLECASVCVSAIYFNRGFKVIKGILCKA